MCLPQHASLGHHGWLLLSGLWTCCHAACFLDAVWRAEEILLVPDVQFGAAIDPTTGKRVTLVMDIAMPPARDLRTERPAFLCIHGGRFHHGTRSTGCGTHVREYLVERGYISVSIDYRLTAQGNQSHLDHYGKGQHAIGGGGVYLPARDAAHDAKAAVRYLRSHASELRIDPERIFAIGHSAGAVTALYMGYIDVGEGDSGSPGFSSRLSTVVAFAGCLQVNRCKATDADGLPVQCSEENGVPNLVHMVNGRAKPPQPPLLLVHGTADDIVDFEWSNSLYRRASATALKHDFIRIQNGDHHAVWIPQHGQRMARFLYETLSLDKAACPAYSGSATGNEL